MENLANFVQLTTTLCGVHARVKWSTSSKQKFYPCNPMRKKGEAVSNRMRTSLVYRENEQLRQQKTLRILARFKLSQAEIGTSATNVSKSILLV